MRKLRLLKQGVWYHIRTQRAPRPRVYIDECGIKEHLQREYGRALRGKKVEDTKRGRKFHRVNVVAAVIHGKSWTKKMRVNVITVL